MAGTHTPLCRLSFVLDGQSTQPHLLHLEPWNLAAWLDWDETIHSLCNNWRFLARSAWTSVFHLFSGICLLFFQFLSFSICEPSVGYAQKEPRLFFKETWSFPKWIKLLWGFVRPSGHDGQHDQNIWTIPPSKLDPTASLLASARVQSLSDGLLHFCRPFWHSHFLAIPWICRICFNCEVKQYCTSVQFIFLKHSTKMLWNIFFNSAELWRVVTLSSACSCFTERVEEVCQFSIW